MIGEDYCSYEIAKLLKEKGFDGYDWCCSHVYTSWQMLINGIPANDDDDFTYAPTHQMAMKWLRENNIIITPQPEYFSCDRCESWGIDIWAFGNYKKLPGDFPTYEEAVEAALHWTLENLL